MVMEYQALHHSCGTQGVAVEALAQRLGVSAEVVVHTVHSCLSWLPGRLDTASSKVHFESNFAQTVCADFPADAAAFCHYAAAARANQHVDAWQRCVTLVRTEGLRCRDTRLRCTWAPFVRWLCRNICTSDCPLSYTDCALRVLRKVADAGLTSDLADLETWLEQITLAIAAVDESTTDMMFYGWHGSFGVGTGMGGDPAAWQDRKQGAVGAELQKCATAVFQVVGHLQDAFEGRGGPRLTAVGTASIILLLRHTRSARILIDGLGCDSANPDKEIAALDKSALSLGAAIVALQSVPGGGPASWRRKMMHHLVRCHRAAPPPYRTSGVVTMPKNLTVTPPAVRALFNVTRDRDEVAETLQLLCKTFNPHARVRGGWLETLGCRDVFGIALAEAMIRLQAVDSSRCLNEIPVWFLQGVLPFADVVRIPRAEVNGRLCVLAAQLMETMLISFVRDSTSEQRVVSAAKEVARFITEHGSPQQRQHVLRCCRDVLEQKPSLGDRLLTCVVRLENSL